METQYDEQRAERREVLNLFEQSVTRGDILREDWERARGLEDPDRIAEKLSRFVLMRRVRRAKKKKRFADCHICGVPAGTTCRSKKGSRMHNHKHRRVKGEGE